MIYCVEDDASIRELVVYTLNSTGFQAEGFDNSKDFFQMVAVKPPELVLLDIMLPDEDGVAILKKLKHSPATQGIPVIMVTAKSAEYDKVIGLDSGADDYVTKPFGMMELISRIKAVLRRSVPKELANEQTVGDVTINADKHTVTAHGETVALTLKEFQLLRVLMENPGVVLTRDKLLETVWGYDFDGETRTVDVHIRTLRQKLGSSGAMIETVRGIGYRVGGVK